ncbi:MAG: TMEM165/GDT1 family protein, partial [candidate division NC10 bacterium]
MRPERRDIRVPIPFGTVALAELGDKTQLAVICLASKTRRHGQLFLG